MSIYFFILKGKLFRMFQLARFLRSFGKSKASEKHLKSVKSSTQSRKFQFLKLDPTPFIKGRNNKGPRVLPSGIPEVASKA